MIRIRINIIGKKRNKLFEIIIIKSNSSRNSKKYINKIGYFWNKNYKGKFNNKNYKNWIIKGAKPSLKVNFISKLKIKINKWNY